MDISSYQISSDPKTWVFDDLVSAALLNHVDHNFTPQVTIVNSVGIVDTWRVADPVLAQEFIDLLILIGGIEPVENSLKQVTLGDVLKQSQWCHMDRLEVGGKFSHVPEHTIGFLDMSKQDVKTRHRSGGGQARVIVPTTSFVVYFEDYPGGGIVFPDAPGFDSAAAGTATGVRGDGDGGMSIDGRRGRIIMFQNYGGEHRSVNPNARHFGTFDPLVPKRNFIGGLVSNENPMDCVSGESHGVPGLLYGVCEGILPREQIQNESLPPQGYRFGWHGGHHEGFDGPYVDEEEERLRRLLAASISRETATQYPICEKGAVLHLLTVFSKVDSVRESASMKPMHSDIWWYILSMMNGRDLIPKNVEEEGSEDDHDEKEEENACRKIVSWIRKMKKRTIKLQNV